MEQVFSREVRLVSELLTKVVCTSSNQQFACLLANPSTNDPDMNAFDMASIDCPENCMLTSLTWRCKCWSANKSNYAHFPNVNQIAAIQLAYHRSVFDCFKEELCAGSPDWCRPWSSTQ